jgi:hypothetical protein
MDQKQRLINLAGSGHFTMTELCRHLILIPCAGRAGNASLPVFSQYILPRVMICDFLG